MTSFLAARPASLTVVLLGAGTPSEEALRAALRGLPTAPDIDWTVVTSEAAPRDVQVVVCDGAERVAEATRRWPDAATVALVSPRDDGAAVVAALDAGANVCVRGGESDLVAAYVHSIARRTRFVATEAGR